MSAPLDQISTDPQQLFNHPNQKESLSPNRKRKRGEEDLPLLENPGFQGRKVTIHYPNGNIYVGEVIKAALFRKKILPKTSSLELEKLEIRNFPYGSGEMRYPDGKVYKGGFLDKRPDGPGQLYCPAGKLLYTGGWQKGKKHGIGKEFGVDGIYEGMFKNGYRHGKGTLFTKEENGIYVGDWEGGVKQGSGTEIFPSKRIYTGGLLLGKPHGWGTLFSEISKSIYQGFWYRGQPND